MMMLRPIIGCVCLLAVCIAARSHPDPGGYNKFESIDTSREGLPKLSIRGRVLDLLHGEHFDEHLQDTPNGMRPPSLVAFHRYNDPQCKTAFEQLNFVESAETLLPSRSRLMVATYDMAAAPYRAWYKFTPERDLAQRFGVGERCPALAWVPAHCDGHTQWCVQEGDNTSAVKKIGCEDFVDQCAGVELWDPEKDTSWVEWVLAKLSISPDPQVSPVFGTLAKQEQWILGRDRCSMDNQLRNAFHPPVLPAFTETGYKAVPIPDELTKYLRDFWTEHQNTLDYENWDTGSSSFLNFHEARTSFVSLDIARQRKEEMIDQYVKPHLEAWAGIPLKQTSVYGVRKYPKGSVLKMHTDRTDVLVISCTLSLDKQNAKETDKEWPIEGVDWQGNNIRYTHEPGTMLMYESAKFIHGRPYRNEGPDHLGVFTHFMPADGNWGPYAGFADRSVDAHTTHRPYRSTPVREPSNIQYTSVRYAEGSKKKSAPGTASPAEQRPVGSPAEQDREVRTEFHNTGKQPMEVYWDGTQHQPHSPSPVPQCSLAPGAACAINTFDGHRFFWSAPKAAAPLRHPDAIVHIGKAPRVVRFGLNSHDEL